MLRYHIQNKILINLSKYRLNEKIPRAREFFRAHSLVLVARNEEAYLPSEEWPAVAIKLDDPTKAKSFVCLLWHFSVYIRNKTVWVPFRTVSSKLCLFATLETRRELGRVDFRKDFWDCYWGQGENWPIADRRVPNNNPRILCES